MKKQDTEPRVSRPGETKRLPGIFLVLIEANAKTQCGW
jgi:hypothetical protein